tara:strand:- start:118 stop:327 length:210 start_codon:yes stop_codon:yes gene_type:complete
MLALSGSSPAKQVHVKLVTVIENESIIDIANVIQHGHWKFEESSESKNQFKFGVFDGKYVILKYDWTMY